MSERLEPSPPARTVFLSYASEDRPAAQNLRDALAALGLTVWYDESGLDGGDAWDHKIRRQIRECDYFMALVSAHTDARPEGYFRREWRLAVERTQDMADDHTFLLPIVIDDTTQAAARVPEKFLSVQWLRLPGGRSTPALEALCRRLLAGKGAVESSSRRRAPSSPTPSRVPASEYPPFPHHEPGQTVRFWAQTVGWMFQCARIFFQRFPKWLRILIYIWLALLVIAKACTPTERHSSRGSYPDARALRQMRPVPGNAGTVSASDVSARIAREISAEVGAQLGGKPLVAVPFSSPADDPTARKLAESVFAQVYGRLELSHHGLVGLTKEPLASPDASSAIERGRSLHSRYVLFGSVVEPAQTLSLKLVAVADGSVLWSQSYPLAHVDAAQIAADADSKIPDLSD